MDGINLEEVSSAKATLEEFDRARKGGRREPFSRTLVENAALTMLRWNNYLENRLASPLVQGDSDNGRNP